MKKLIIFTVLVLLAFTNVQAQDVRFGVKAGPNFSNVNGDDADFDGRVGAHIGGVARIGLTEMIALQPELVFSSQGYK